MQERTEDMIKRFEKMPSKWLAEKHDTNVELYDLAMQNNDPEAAARFQQRVISADAVLASRYGLDK